MEVSITIEPAIADVDPPAHMEADEAWRWLDWFTRQTWNDLPTELQNWRDNIVRIAGSLFGDSMLVTHMAGINILLGRAISSRQTMPFWPANCSINVIETGDRWRIVASAASCPSPSVASALRCVDEGERAAPRAHVGGGCAIRRDR